MGIQKVKCLYEDLKKQNVETSNEEEFMDSKHSFEKSKVLLNLHYTKMTVKMVSGDTEPATNNPE